MKIRYRPTPTKETCLANVYVWEWPVRVCHWLIAGSIWVLSITGIYIGNPMLTAPGPASEHFVMGTTKVIHFYSAIVFTLAVVSRVLWMFVGNKYSAWDKFLPAGRLRRKGLLPTLRYYLFGLRLPPGFVGHNPLAGVTYFFVFLAYGVMIATGLGMYAASAHVDSPMGLFTFFVPLVGGLQTAHWIHHIVMWLLWMFIVHHIYSAIMMSQVEANATVESIFSGHKFVPREDLVFSGYRFIDRDTHRGG